MRQAIIQITLRFLNLVSVYETVTSTKNVMANVKEIYSLIIIKGKY